MDTSDPDKALAERRKYMMESDFNPVYRPESMPTADMRSANAAEYSAYQLGQINRNLARLIEHLDKRGA